MRQLAVCVVCLSTNVKLFEIVSGPLKNDFLMVSGIQASEFSSLPKYLCVECSAYVKRFKSFRNRCQRARFTLQKLFSTKTEITESTINKLNRKSLGINPTLSYLDIEKSHYEEASNQLGKHNRLRIKPLEDIPILHVSTNNYKYEVEIDEAQSKENKLSLLIENIKEESADYINDETEQNEETLFEEPSTSVVNDMDYDDENFDQNEEENQPNNSITDKRKNIDLSKLEEEYAVRIPISLKEAKAASEVYKMFVSGKYACECGKSFTSEKRFNAHKRMHDTHISGTHTCTLCNYYYKTEFLLKTHMAEKHMYKYVCKKCPEVNFDRTSAKQHFIWTHLQTGKNKHSKWYEARPSWLSKKGGKRVKGVVSLRPVQKKHQLPDDFLKYSPVSHEEQYTMILERRSSRNYLEAQYKCELCFRGFREPATYGKHMNKHDPAISGQYQCDMCKLYFRNTRKMYKHMNITHLFKYSCQTCDYFCYNRGQAHMHYRWHKNVKYPCPHCDKVFSKISTRLTHVRIKHPSNYICTLCGHSFVSENGLYCHRKISHSIQEVKGSSNEPKPDPEHPLYCSACCLQFASDNAFKTHLGSAAKHALTNTSIKAPRKGGAGGPRRSRGRPRNGSSEIVNTGVPTATTCELCHKHLVNDVQARKHYEGEHPGHEMVKRYMCDVCGHTTRQYANLTVHMRTHTNEKPYGCPHCGRRFSMPSNRDRHLVVHTGEKRYQCQHCSRRFTQSSAVKLHIQTVHLKIPYAPWDKKNRKRRKELETAAVSTMEAPPLPPAKLHLDAADYLSAYITYSDE